MAIHVGELNLILTSGTEWGVEICSMVLTEDCTVLIREIELSKSMGRVDLS